MTDLELFECGKAITDLGKLLEYFDGLNWIKKHTLSVQKVKHEGWDMVHIYFDGYDTRKATRQEQLDLTTQFLIKPELEKYYVKFFEKLYLIDEKHFVQGRLINPGAKLFSLIDSKEFLKDLPIMINNFAEHFNLPTIDKLNQIETKLLKKQFARKTGKKYFAN
jgi:hypothetical protein